MKALKIACVSLLCWLPVGLWAQIGILTGTVTDATDKSPLAGVRIHWSGTEVGTLTDEGGNFRIRKVKSSRSLVVTSFGYVPDTIEAGSLSELRVALHPSIAIDTVEITARQRTTEISMLDPMKTENIGERELLKAACCNLSESFETSPSVDVSFTDAVTGTRQIQMLGLAGPYTQIMQENMPNVRGLAAIHGLGFIPGTWVENIALNKGTGSVVNGYEGFAGQINVCLRNPDEMDRLFLNLYVNRMGRSELNTHIGQRLGKYWGTALMLHGRINPFRNDYNNDGFLDNPLDRRFIAMNRWHWQTESGWSGQVGGKITLSDDIGGQVAFDPDSDEGSTNIWGLEQRIRRGEGWVKVGKYYRDMPWRSLEIQVSGMNHEQQSSFGLKRYDAGQSTLYSNFIYQSILGNTNHKFKTGISFMYDDYRERLDQDVWNRTEIVPGAFFEYTYSLFEKLDLVAGMRADYHNLFGFFATPRLHARYALGEKTVARISVGRGQRTANIIAENVGLLASSREIVVESGDSSLPYGLQAEVAWNFGANLTRMFTLGYREGSFSLDFYRTEFRNQVVVDLDRSPQQAVFYNLDGRSFSNSLQAQVDYELIKRLDVRLAYRWFDVRTTYDGVLRQKPLLSTHRAFLNLAYGTRNHWRFDATLNWQGPKRIPLTTSNPVEYQLADHSPAFFMLNGQVSKTWRERFEVYLGGENLLNFRQPSPILAADQPFSPYFDSSMIWGPVFGRNIYAGLRLRWI